mgnify:CR=1 FL=1|tara:strand:+ start:5408 stop:6019 length:612 start_codon:yes stop_codon:yes gene_type:complete
MGTYGATTRYNHDKCKEALLTFLNKYPYGVPFIMDDVMDYIVPLPPHLLKDVKASKSEKVGVSRKNRYGDTTFFRRILRLAIEDYRTTNAPSIIVKGRWKADIKDKYAKKVYIKLDNKISKVSCFDCGIPINVKVEISKKGIVRYFNRTFTCPRCYENYTGRKPEDSFFLKRMQKDVVDVDEDNDDNWLDELMIMENDENVMD